MKLPIPADWDGESWCRWAICWPDSDFWEAILRGFLTLPQRGWTWDETTGSILAVQETGREIKELNIPLTGVLMACNDTELTQAFSDIALAIRALAAAQCCDNLTIDNHASFHGTVTSPAGNSVPIFGSEPPIGLEPGTFPPEFEDVDEYLLGKCQMANYIADGLIGSLNGLSNLTIAEFTIAIIATVFLFASAIVFPPSALPALMIGLGVLGGATGLLYVAATKLQENRAEFVCLLYEGENSGAVIGLLSDFFDVIVALVGTTTVLGAAIKGILMLIMNTDTLNAMFDGRARAAYPNSDCSGCGSSCGDCISRLTNDGTFMNYLSVPAPLFTLESQNYGAYHGFFCTIGAPGEYKMEFQELTGWSLSGEGDNFFVTNTTAEAPLYSGNTWASFQAACEANCLTIPTYAFSIFIISATAFSVQCSIDFCE